jgi:predicted phosphodiesterase
MNRAAYYWALTALAGAACGGLPANQEGDISASHTGSIVTALAPRRLASEPFAACGSGEPSAGSTLTRLPFLQQVTSTSADIVFRTPDAQTVEVDVTALDGTPVTSVQGQVDPSVAGQIQKIATIEGLEPDVTYCYSLRGQTAPAGFRTAPAPGTGAAVRFAAWGDSGYAGSDQRTLLGQILDVPLDLAIHTGDLAYEQGTAPQLETTVFEPYTKLMRNFPFYPVSGNHDYETDRAEPLLEAFVLPENGDAERWYSFDWGDVHFVGLDTEQTGPREAEWLDRDLQKNQLPWTIVFGHKPPYSSGEHGSDQAFRDHFVPVLEKYQVPLVLSGHDHDYERTQVMNGVTYVVTGGGGRGTRPVGTSSFTAYSDAVIHFVYVEIQGSRLVLHAIDGAGSEFDQAVIERSAG